MIEYLIGGYRSKERLTPNSYAISTTLFSEIYTKIIFYMYADKNTHNLCAIEIDNNIIIGIKYENVEKLEIIFEENKPYFDSMVIQQVVKQCWDDKNLYWINTTYIEIEYNGKKYELGEKHKEGVEEGEDNGIQLKYHYVKEEIVKNHFYISGINLHNSGICALQIIEMNHEEINDFEKIQHLFSYGQGKYGIVEAKCEQIEKMIMDERIISFENNSVFVLLDLLYMRLARWTDDNSVIRTYYPKMLALIDEAIIEREFDVIHSVLRLNRYLKYLIIRNEEFSKRKRLQHNLGTVVKVHKIWNTISEIMELIQEIHNADLELNCYQISYLDNDNINFIYSFITIICQIGLILLLGLSLLNTNKRDMFPLIEGWIIIPIISIFTVLIVSKQFTNTLEFHKTFPDAKDTFVGKCDIFSNILCAIVVVILNFFILSYSDNLIDIVLNSLAALFIIELDDTMVFISDNAKMDLYRQKCISILNEKLYSIPSLYYGKNTWEFKDGFELVDKNVYVNRELCEICYKEESLEINIV